MNRPGSDQHLGVAASSGRLKPAPSKSTQWIAVERVSRGHGQIGRGCGAPQGLLCLITTAEGPASERTIDSALSRSSRLLYDSSLPESCWALTRFAPLMSPCVYRAAAGAGFAVPQNLFSRQAKRQRAGNSSCSNVPATRWRWPDRRPRCGQRRPAPTAGAARAWSSRRGDLVENLGVLFRIGGDRHKGVVLGRGRIRARSAISICSTASSKVTPARATVASNGYS